jgi:hypothetical protein
MLPSGLSRESFSTGYGRTLSTANKNQPRTHLSPRYAEKTDRHQHSTDGYLIITKLDAIEVLNRQAVRSDEAIQCQDLVHLNSSD